MANKVQAEALFQRGDEESAAGARALQDGNADQGHECFRMAIESYREALGFAPEDELLLRSNLLLCIGARHFGLGELDLAAARFDEVIDALADESEGEGADLLAQARLNRADYLLATGKIEECRAVVDAVLAQFPDHAYAVYLSQRCATNG